MSSRYLIVTDGQTDGQTKAISIPRYALVHCAVKNLNSLLDARPPRGECSRCISSSWPPQTLRHRAQNECWRWCRPIYIHHVMYRPSPHLQCSCVNVRQVFIRLVGRSLGVLRLHVRLSRSYRLQAPWRRRGTSWWHLGTPRSWWVVYWKTFTVATSPFAAVHVLRLSKLWWNFLRHLRTWTWRLFDRD